MVDVVTVGNGIIDAFLSLHDANAHCRVNTETAELCVTYGQKIPVDHCEFILGGDACNVAVGLKRLGLSTAVVAEIGNDEFASKIINTLDQEGVDTTYILKKGQSSFSVCIQFQGERTLFVEHQKRSHEFSFENIATKWLYLTSLGHDWKHAYARACAFVRDNNVKLVFNPGTIQIADGLEAITEALRLTEVLFLNKDEAMTLLGHTADEKILLDELHKLGPKIVVITDGKRGSFVRDATGNMLTKEIINRPVVGKTGAGDAYTSGFLAAYFQNLSLDTAMTWGTKNAASVIGYVGSQKGLLTRSAIG